ncbi:MAG: hypothetical protein IMF04_00390 [Proteobacteria bacterium]|nr:hypothetical protein [Pseudomonadota bacterium]
MNFKKIPAEAALAISGLIAKFMTSILTSVIVVFLIWVVLDSPNLVAAFIGAMAAQVTLRAFDKEVRKDAMVVWYWIKEQSDSFPKWAYSSKKEKQDMAFMNIINKTNTDDTKKPASDDLKASANRSLLDD